MRRALATTVIATALLAGCTNDPAGSQGEPVTGASATVEDRTNRDGTSAPVADPVYPAYGNPALDVLHYDLALAWAPPTRTLTGTATIRIRAVRTVQQLRLDFSDAYTLSAISVDGASVPGRVADGDLVVDRAVPGGSTVTLSVGYTGTPTTVAMPSHRSDAEPLGLTVTADGSLWTMQEPYGASTWYPANDQPSDKALYDIAVTVPDGWSAIAGGTPGPSGGGTFRYASTVPVASYLTTLAVGQYTKTSLSGPRGLPITLWTRSSDGPPRLDNLKQLPVYLQWLEDRFGPYPFASTGAVLVPSATAMETQQMMTIGGDAVESAGAAVLVHELAHQWFGDAVGPATWRDVWMNEGWASYVEQLYRHRSAPAALDGWERQARGADGTARAAQGPPGNPRADSFAENNVYVGPALMLRQIHKAIGDERFFALGRAWAAAHTGTARTRAEFVAFVNRQTGRDFTALINSWLDSPTTPS
ncbi:M1 family metallopeptidase [Dactylosporangium matsuzakiense]|uniref:Aminopeptidase N n=1 Tax=Dactylosporangium matsuzakiense TaxID=53360 RepID=A0A9W6KE84_9ACTN|nr:M1 family metallopeptidase [Dactylosporangium matsuzakiense]UWZ42054.1 M1 family metallopeptidase [Dactylosporangium matsuzakiense]GLK99672.1 metallopeptidase [Dactylosporangium matsuzakiense]